MNIEHCSYLKLSIVHKCNGASSKFGVGLFDQFQVVIINNKKYDLLSKATYVNYMSNRGGVGGFCLNRFSNDTNLDR